MQTANTFWDFTHLIPQFVENVVCAHNERFGVANTYHPRTGDRIWEKRNWRGIPGICYTGETDTCLTGRIEAPDNVLYDEGGSEFIFRQPRNEAELKAVIRAGMVDPFDEYGFDGHRRWNLASIRDWWRQRQRIFNWIAGNGLNPHLYAEQSDAMLDFQLYMVSGAERFLQSFAFFLDNGRHANGADRLPDLV